MIKVPKNLLTLNEAAKKYGFKRISIQDYVRRGRLEAIKIGWMWFTTDRAMKKYLKSRDLEKIPKKYRNKS